MLYVSVLTMLCLVIIIKYCFFMQNQFSPIVVTLEVYGMHKAQLRSSQFNDFLKCLYCFTTSVKGLSWAIG